MPLSAPLGRCAVVITGASGGLGTATALLLARRATRLVLAARDPGALDETAARCRRHGAPVLTVPTDVADPAQVEALAAAADAEYGRIDAWIDNAGVAHFGTLLDAPLPRLRRVVDVDLFGYLHGARAAIPRMRAGGVVVMVGSVLSEASLPYQGGYVAAKHAVLGLAGTLRQELRIAGNTGVSVSVLLPASIDTDLFAHASNATGRRLRPPPPAVAAIRVARRLVRLLESPRPTAYAGIGARAVGAAARWAPSLTERLLGAYGRRATFVADGQVPDTDGNLFAAGGDPPEPGTAVRAPESGRTPWQPP